MARTQRKWKVLGESLSQLRMIGRRTIARQAGLEVSLRQACDRRDSTACLVLAWLLGYQKRYAESVPLLRKACGARQQGACLDLGSACSDLRVPGRELLRAFEG